jgi:hypothetical protein
LRRATANSGGVELLLAGRDLVPRRPHPVHGHLHLVAQAANAGDDVVVLILEGPLVLRPRDQVVEAFGLEENGDQVGLVGLVDGDEAFLQDLDRLAQALLQIREPRLRLRELRLLQGKSLAHGGRLVTQLGHLSGQPVDLGGLVADPGGEHAGVLLDVRELRLLRVQLLLEVLPGRAAHDEAARAHARGKGARERKHHPPGTGHLWPKGCPPVRRQLKRRLQETRR